MCINHTRLSAIVIPPQTLNKFFSGEHPLPPTDKHQQQIKLLKGKINSLILNPDLAGFRVYLQPGVFQQRILWLCSPGQ
ncbi:hypothetical protein D3C81_1851810 [compost metagenome]